MKHHEAICSKQSHLCPVLLTKEKCLWHGNRDEIWKHIEAKHPQHLMSDKKLELDLNEDFKSCKAFSEDGTCFLVLQLYNKAKGLTVCL